LLQRAQLPCLDLVIRLNRPIADASRTNIHNDLADLLRRLPA
jgi:RNase P protein component